MKVPVSCAVVLFCLCVVPARAEEGWIDLLKSGDLNAFQAPTGNWAIVSEVALAPDDPRTLQGNPGKGVLFNGSRGRTHDLCTRQEYGDIELHLEFLIAGKSNSGVYLLGSYELQIYDSFGVTKDHYPGIECGGIYPRWIDNRNVEGHSPRINASLPAGQWQSFDVIFRAPRFDARGRKTANAVFVKVVHNGKLIHEQVELSGPTRGGRPEHAVGPLVLQGDHGPVAFRNLRIRPLQPADSVARPSGYPIGTCMIGLKAAREAGLDGVQLPVRLDGDHLDVASPSTRAACRRQMKETGLPICGLMMGVLNDYPLASDPRGPAWLEQAIDATQDLGARVILVAFFGKGDLRAADGTPKHADVDVVVERLRAAAPRAQRAGVVLAIEDYLDARQNLEILRRVNSPAVQVYYDVYNTGVTRGYDVPAEIRLLRGHLAQFHFKNGAQYLGQGKLRLEPILAAMNEVGYQGWIVLETSSPTNHPIADARRNGSYLRNLFEGAGLKGRR
jgi:sugar phosphate isomerase/epimerase